MTAVTQKARLERWLPAASMLMVVLVGACLPLIRTPTFYYWDDTLGSTIGFWQRIAQDLLHGQSPFLQLDMWRGGNFVSEAATGIWNPVILALILLVSPLDNLALGITLAKITLLMLGAGGVYLLARGYGATRWLSAAAGAALPLSGWLLFMDATAWTYQTAIAAFTPWAWWAVRRCYLKGFRPASIVVAVVASYTLVSAGDPYGLLALAVVYISLLVEALFSRRRSAILWLIPLGLGTVLLVAVVYLPFLLTSSYGFRQESAVFNDEFLAVNLSDFLGMSMPSHHPWILSFPGAVTFSATYLAWFVLPLAPWLRWREIADGWRPLSSALTFGGVFLAFTLGPSQLGMFRWPARFIPYVYIAAIVVFAVVASKGLERSRPRARAAVSVGLIVAAAWVAWSDNPGAWKWHVVVAVLIALALLVVIRWLGLGMRGSIALMLGTLVFLGPQLMLSPQNATVADYRVPVSRSEMQDSAADKTDGLVVQIFDVGLLVSENPPETRWEDLLVGDMPSVAGYASTTAYTGIGFNALDQALCVTYNGGTCPEAWDRLWEKPDGADAVLADLLGATHVVVQNGYADDDQAPDGWSVSSRTDIVTVYTRDDALPYPGTLTVAGDGVTVTEDALVGKSSEELTVSTEESETTITFGRVAWPGYQLTVDGETVPTRSGPAGLLTADLPALLDDAKVSLTFTPPGLYPGLASAAAGLVLLGTLIVFAARRGRRAESVEVE